MLSLISNSILKNDLYLATIGFIWCLAVVGCIIAKLYRAIRVFLLSRPFPQELTFYGEWAVVTGGSSGIGKSYARRLARRGMNIVLISNELEALKLSAKEIESEYGVVCCYIHADFTKGLEVFERVMDEIADKDIGILINGAGIFGRTPCYFLQESEKNTIAMIDLHITSVINMSSKVLPSMLSKKKGIIINISSASSLIPLPYFSIYSACKAFSDRFTRSLHWEYFLNKDVRFQSLIPYFVSTRYTSKNDLVNSLAMNCETFTASANCTIGNTYYTSGCWLHELICFGISICPPLFIHKAMMLFRVREK